MITMKSKYALKALAQLARARDGAPMLISEIAEREEIPHKFLELILRELKQHGLLTSRKGRGGGYLLGKAPRDISIAAVLRALDGPLAPVPCLSQTAYRRCEGCADEATCGVRLVLKDVHEAQLALLERTTLADVIERVDAATGKGRGILRYSI